MDHQRVYILPACVIALMITAQVGATAAGIVYKLQHGKPFFYQTWPFVDYPMYSTSSGPEVQTATLEFSSKTANGERIELTPEAMGLNFWAWRYNIVERLVAPPIDDPQQAELAALVESHRVDALGKVVHAAQQLAGEPPATLIIERTIHQLEGRHIARELFTQTLAVHGDRLESLGTVHTPLTENDDAR